MKEREGSGTTEQPEGWGRDGLDGNAAGEAFWGEKSRNSV